LGDNGRVRDLTVKSNELGAAVIALIEKVKDLEAQLLSSRRSSWETAALLRVMWELAIESRGKDDVRRRLGVAFEELGLGQEQVDKVLGKPSPLGKRGADEAE